MKRVTVEVTADVQKARASLERVRENVLKAAQTMATAGASAREAAEAFAALGRTLARAERQSQVIDGFGPP